MHSSPYQKLNKTRHLLQNSMLQNPCRESQVLRFEMCKPGAALPHPCLGCTADWLSPALCLLGLPHQLGIPVRVVSPVLAGCIDLKPMSWHASVGVDQAPVWLVTLPQLGLLMDPTSVTTWPCSDPVGWCSVRGYKLNQPPKAMGLTTQRKESPSSMAGSDKKVFPTPWFFETAQTSSPMTHSWAEAYPHCCCTSSFGVCARKDMAAYAVASFACHWSFLLPGEVLLFPDYTHHTMAATKHIFWCPLGSTGEASSIWCWVSSQTYPSHSLNADC